MSKDGREINSRLLLTENEHNTTLNTSSRPDTLEGMGQNREVQDMPYITQV